MFLGQLGAFKLVGSKGCEFSTRLVSNLITDKVWKAPSVWECGVENNLGTPCMGPCCTPKGGISVTGIYSRRIPTDVPSNLLMFLFVNLVKEL